MKVSMNGLRRNLSGDVQSLRDEVQKILDGDWCDHDDLRKAMNDVIADSNVLNCVFSDSDPDFTDISDVEVERIESEDD